MKKTYIQFSFNSAFVSRHDGNEQFALYADVDDVYGGWLAETSGEPMCLNALEDAGCNGVIEEIVKIRSTSATPSQHGGLNNGSGLRALRRALRWTNSEYLLPKMSEEAGSRIVRSCFCVCGMHSLWEAVPAGWQAAQVLLK